MSALRPVGGVRGYGVGGGGDRAVGVAGATRDGLQGLRRADRNRAGIGCDEVVGVVPLVV